MKKYSSAKWTKGEDDVIIKYFNSTNLIAMQRRLPSRTQSTIKTRANKLKKEGVFKDSTNRKKWSKEEKDYVIKNHGNIKAQEIADVLEVPVKLVWSQVAYLKQTGHIDENVRGTTGISETLKKRQDKEAVEAFKRAMEKEKERVCKTREKLNDLKFQKGKEYKVVSKMQHGVQDKFKGKLIMDCDNFIVLEGNVRECFLKVDFLIGEYKIKEC